MNKPSVPTLYPLGIHVNLTQFIHQLLQVFLVGLMLGMLRIVVPALSESEFGVPKGSFMLLMAFVVAFGFVKASLNFVAGHLADRFGRKKVLLMGWVFAVPIPALILFAPSWNWIVVATILLGIHQGLTWSMTQTAKLDITRADQRGFTLGLNEFSGYLGVALAGVMTGYLATLLPPRVGLLLFGSIVILLALVMTAVWVKETRPYAQAASATRVDPLTNQDSLGSKPSTWELFAFMSWRDRRMLVLCQAGLVEKFVDALVWVFYPVYLLQRGLSVAGLAWVIGVYGFVWGTAQLVTGRLSDRIGRKKPIVYGMWICGAGVVMMLYSDQAIGWMVSAAITGLGMALLYPNLSAAVADLAHPQWRGAAIGIYRFWRDLGYGIGALLLGAVATLSGSLSAGFWFTAAAMFVSGAVVMVLGDETHPRLNSSHRKV